MSRVFNSFHITFTEHLNAEPSPLLPGMTLGTERASTLPSGSHMASSLHSVHTPPQQFSNHNIDISICTPLILYQLRYHVLPSKQTTLLLVHLLPLPFLIGQIIQQTLLPLPSQITPLSNQIITIHRKLVRRHVPPPYNQNPPRGPAYPHAQFIDLNSHINHHITF